MKLRLTALLTYLLLRLTASPLSAADILPPPEDSRADSCLTPACHLQHPDSCPEEVAPLRSLPPVYENRKDNPNFWTNRIRSKTFDISDSTIIYPRFPGFCVTVYNGADRVFNTSDQDYVVPTGKKWKVWWKTSGWTDSYSLDMPDNIHIRMLSHMYMSTGPYISFMAVSVGYAANLNRLISHEPARQKRFDFSFSTSLFEFDIYYTRNRGGTAIRRFEPYSQGKYIDVDFPSLQLENYGLAAFYFLNHGRYYRGAAYNYSKIQKRTQGSWIFGVAASHQYIDFDLSTLPYEMIMYMPADARMHFKFVYNDYCLIAGYGWNLVFNPHWVFNVTGMPAFGLRHCMADNDDGRKNLPAISRAARSGLAYNLRNFFVGGYASIQANWYLNKQYSFINGVGSFGMCVGLRF